VCDEHHGRVERDQLALEPFEARHIEMVCRLVEQEQIRISSEGTRKRCACQLSARERLQPAIEIGVHKAEAPHDADRAVTPRVTTRVLQPGLRVRIATERCLVVCSLCHLDLEAPKLILERDQLGGSRQHVLAQRQFAF
jgi:hypothetical protein